MYTGLIIQCLKHPQVFINVKYNPVEDDSLKVKFKVNPRTTRKSEQHIPPNCRGRPAVCKGKKMGNKVSKKDVFGNKMPPGTPTGFM